MQNGFSRYCFGCKRLAWELLRSLKPDGLSKPSLPPTQDIRFPSKYLVIIACSCWRRATGFSWIEGWSLHVHWTFLSVAAICNGKNSHQILTSVITSYINGVPLIPKDLLTLSTLNMPPAAPGICCWPLKCRCLIAEMELCHRVI